MNLNQEKSMIGSMEYDPYVFLKRAIMHNDSFAFAALATGPIVAERIKDGLMDLDATFPVPTIKEITRNLQKMWDGEEVAIEIVNNLEEDHSVLRCVWGKKPSMKGYLPETLFLMNWLRAACEEAPQ